MWVSNNFYSSTLENLFYIKFLLKIGKGTGSHRKGVHSVSQRKFSFWGKRRRTKTLPRHSISQNKGWLKVETKATNNTNRSLYCVATTTTCSSTGNDRDHSESCYQHERDRPSCRSTKFLAVTRAYPGDNTALSLRPPESGLIQNHSCNNALMVEDDFTLWDFVRYPGVICEGRRLFHGWGYKGSFAGNLFGNGCKIVSV